MGGYEYLYVYSELQVVDMMVSLEDNVNLFRAQVGQEFQGVCFYICSFSVMSTSPV